MLTAGAVCSNLLIDEYRIATGSLLSQVEELLESVESVRTLDEFHPSIMTNRELHV
jgi:hypothetical protein